MSFWRTVFDIGFAPILSANALWDWSNGELRWYWAFTVCFLSVGYLLQYFGVITSPYSSPAPKLSDHQ